MRNTYITRPNMAVEPPRPNFFVQVLLALVSGTALFMLITLAAAMSYDSSNRGVVYPGVTAAGVDLAGLAPAEAAALLAERVDYPVRGQIVFQDGTNTWVAKPADLGFYFDSQGTALAAYNYARSGSPVVRLNGQLSAWRNGYNVPPQMVYDERAARSYLATLAAQIDRPAVEASLQINGADVIVTAGQVGRSLDIDAVLASLRDQLPTLNDGIIQLKVDESTPVILDVTAQAEIARKILSGPLTLSIPDPEEGDPGPWTFEQAELAKMLDIVRVDTSEGAAYQVGLNTEGLRIFLEGVAPNLVRYPVNARFIFNDDTRQLDLLENAVIGRQLDVDASMEQINEKLAAGEHDIPVHISYTNPDVTDNSTAESLGIRELIHSETSFFAGSGSARIQNITTAAGRFHGVLVPPGATFSMADVLGDVSLDNGYAEALIIFGDRTIQGVGGGVCQVSTTLFRTVFFAGYPIVERHPHAYRVGYYEQINGSGGRNEDYAGLDATVFVPVVDFKFVNDSSSWLLMETYMNGPSLTWKFYGTDDGREVSWDTTGLMHVTEPPDPVYEENPDLDEGEIKQVDWAVAGADITVSRQVTRNGEVIITDTYSTHYIPWRAVYQYGPGTEIPDQSEE